MFVGVPGVTHVDPCMPLECPPDCDVSRVPLEQDRVRIMKTTDPDFRHVNYRDGQSHAKDIGQKLQLFSTDNYQAYVGVLLNNDTSQPVYLA